MPGRQFSFLVCTVEKNKNRLVHIRFTYSPVPSFGPSEVLTTTLCICNNYGVCIVDNISCSDSMGAVVPNLHIVADISAAVFFFLIFLIDTNNVNF